MGIVDVQEFYLYKTFLIDNSMQEDMLSMVYREGPDIYWTREETVFEGKHFLHIWRRVKKSN